MGLASLTQQVTGDPRSGESLPADIRLSDGSGGIDELTSEISAASVANKLTQRSRLNGALRHKRRALA
jgi:hypothetical protein